MAKKEKLFQVYKVGIYTKNWMYSPRGTMIEMRVRNEDDSQNFTNELNALLDKYGIKQGKAQACPGRVNDIGELEFDEYQNEHP